MLSNGFSKETVLRRGCTAVAFLLPLKLSIAYIALIPLIILWLWHDARRLTLSRLPLAERRVIVPVALFLVSVTLSALLGLNPQRSLTPLISLFFFSSTLLVFSRYGRLIPVVTALLAGQAIAATHSVLDAGFPNSLPGLFIGKVSESGQLALTLVVALGLLWRTKPLTLQLLSNGERRWLLASGALTTIALISFGFRGEMRTPWPVTVTLLAAACALSVASLSRAVRCAGEPRRYALLLALQIPLLVAALMVNLKRGPWLGVVVGSTIFFTLYAPRLAALLISVAALSAATIAPISERLAASYQHFTIAGGRSTIWRIGMELIAEFPLGIGFHNSDTLRKFAPEIPPELRHFHNNILNITAENGWLSCALFIWFICAAIRRSFSRPLDALHVAIGCAIISWQTAGLVEYNVGDSEVMLLVWILLGALLWEQRAQSRGPSAEHPRGRA